MAHHRYWHYGTLPPLTPRQKRFLLVIVDYFTRWVELFALRQTTATHIANVLIDEVICRYGIPLHILSDNGPQFISHLFNAICTALGITHKFTANYHPQTNMTERVNHTLKAQITIYAQQHPGYSIQFIIRWKWIVPPWFTTSSLHRLLF